MAGPRLRLLIVLAAVCGVVVSGVANETAVEEEKEPAAANTPELAFMPIRELRTTVMKKMKATMALKEDAKKETQKVQDELKKELEFAASALRAQGGSVDVYEKASEGDGDTVPSTGSGKSETDLLLNPTLKGRDQDEEEDPQEADNDNKEEDSDKKEEAKPATDKEEKATRIKPVEQQKSVEQEEDAENGSRERAKMKKSLEGVPFKGVPKVSTKTKKHGADAPPETAPGQHETPEQKKAAESGGRAIPKYVKPKSE